MICFNHQLILGSVWVITGEPVIPRARKTIHFANAEVFKVCFKFGLPPVNGMPHLQRFFISQRFHILRNVLMKLFFHAGKSERHYSTLC